MKEYSIAEVTRITGLSRTAILYYETKGLIFPRHEAGSNYRKYSIEDVSQMLFYQSLKPLGISVEEYAAAAGKSETDLYEDTYDLILLKKAEYMKRLAFYITMWEETLTFAHILRSKNEYYQIQTSREAWVLKLKGSLSKKEAFILKNWKDHFLQRNLSYFFEKEKVENKDYSFERGLSCYADCAIRIDETLRGHMQYIPAKTCLLMAASVDLEQESFEDIFKKADKFLKKEHLTIDGDPWGNMGYRDEKPGEKAESYIFLWIPVK